MGGLLFDEYPIVVGRKLATAIGLNEAIVLQQVNYWLRNNEKKEKFDTHFRDGRWWTYNTYQDWQKKNFPFWSVRTVQRAFDNLRAKKLLIAGRFNKKKYDKTNWYTIDYDKLKVIEDRLDNLTSPSSQSDVMDDDNLTRPIPETSAETSVSTDTNRILADSDSDVSFTKEQERDYLYLQEQGVWRDRAERIVRGYEPWFINLWIESANRRKLGDNSGVHIAQGVFSNEPPDIPYQTVKTTKDLMTHVGLDIREAEWLALWATREEVTELVQRCNDKGLDPAEHVPKALRARSQEFRLAVAQ